MSVLGLISELKQINPFVHMWMARLYLLRYSSGKGYFSPPLKIGYLLASELRGPDGQSHTRSLDSSC